MLALFVFFTTTISVIAAFMYIIIMGPSPYHRNGCVGKAHRILKQIPIVVGGVCCSMCFGCNQKKGKAQCKACCNHTMHERNWFMVVFYIVLVWTVEILYLFFSLPHLRTSWLSKAVSWGLVLLSEGLYANAVFCDPGKVTTRAELKERQAYTEWRLYKEKGTVSGSGKNALDEAARSPVAASGSGPRRRNRGKGHTPFPPSPSPSASQQRQAPAPQRPRRDGPPRWPQWHLTTPEEYVLNRRYCVDGMLYALAGNGTTDEHTTGESEYSNPEGVVVGLGQMCSTCNVLRPARSKHCSLCNICVRRFDHHCPWINNDVAEGTHRFFLGFLIAHAVSCSWACYDLYRSIRQYLIDRRAWGWVLRSAGGKVFRLRFSDYMVIIVNYCMLDGCLFFFAFFISLVLYGFWGYQMSFVTANLTMNDLNKIEDVANFVADLPTLELVAREARRAKARLIDVALRKPKALLKLEDPPPASVREGDPAWAEGGKRNKAYRKKVKAMVLHDLKGLYDRGAWANIMEVYFPYRVLTSKNVETAAKVAPVVT